MKKISVITPCYNSARFIKECLLSVQKSITLNQFDLEHIVVDDKSQDNTIEILESLNYQNLKVVCHNENRGSSAARNTGIDLSDADYLFFLDHDDVILQNTFRYLLEKIENDKNEWVFGDFLRADENLSYGIGDDYFGWDFQNPAAVLTSMYVGVHITQHNFLISRQLITNVGKYDESILIPQDFDLITRVLLRKKMPSYIKWPTHIHRFHNNNLTPPQYQQTYKTHQTDVKSFFEKYNSEFTKLLDESQLKKINSYLNS